MLLTLTIWGYAVFAAGFMLPGCSPDSGRDIQHDAGIDAGGEQDGDTDAGGDDDGGVENGGDGENGDGGQDGAGDTGADACYPRWVDLTACDCQPTTCTACTGELLQEDGCGHQQAVSCQLPALSCPNGLACNSQGACVQEDGTATISIDPAEHSLSSFGGAYPRAALLDDGSILAGFDSAITDGRAIRVSKSTDQGLGWTDLGTVAQHTGNIDLANAFPLQLSSGRVLMAFRHHDLFADPIVYRIEVCYSDDRGEHWNFLSTVEATSGIPIWEPFLFSAPDGSLQVYYARERDNSEQDIVLRRSWDDGESWDSLVTVSTAAGSRDGMPAVTLLQDDSLLTVFEAFREDQWGMFVIKSVRSYDDGSTWSERSDLYVPADESRKAGAPYVVSLGNGQLLASFMTDEDSAQIAWPDFASMKVLLSSEAPSVGEFGWESVALTVVEPAAYWPGLYVLPDDRILFLYSKAGVKTRIGQVMYR